MGDEQEGKVSKKEDKIKRGARPFCPLCFHFSMLSWKFRYKAIKMVNILPTYCVWRILYVKNLQLNEETTKKSVVYLKGKEVQ